MARAATIRIFALLLVTPALSGAPATMSVEEPPQDSARIIVGDRAWISRDRPADAHTEGTIAVSPVNPRRMIACAMVIGQTGYRGVRVFASSDRAKSWKLTFESKPARWGGDPVCTYGPDGTAYFAFLPLFPDPRRTYVLTSTDGGNTWSNERRFGRVDRPELAVDSTRGRFHGRIYLHGTGSIGGLGSQNYYALSLFRSADAGKTFQGPATRMQVQDRVVRGIGNGVILDDGSWATVFGDRPQHPPPTPGRPLFAPPGGANTIRLLFVRSTDGGETLEQPSVIGPAWLIKDDIASTSTPRLAVDTSSRVFRGRLYVVWPDSRDHVLSDTPDGRTNILLARSDDGGRTWSDPIVVNDDHPSPDAPPPKHFQPMLAVNRDGVVGVAWYDRRDALDNLGWSVRFTASLDGGQTFLPSVVVAERAVRFGASERWAPFTVVRGGGTSGTTGGPIQAIVAGISYGHHYSGGDYHGMATDSAGVFYPYWIGNATDWHQVYTTPITVKGTPRRHLAGPTVVDLSDRVTLEVERTEYDPANHVASLTVRLRNTSDSPISAPLHVRLLTLNSEIGNPRALDADNALEGPGALYDVSALVTGGTLAPHTSSEERVLRFGINEPRPFKQGDDIKLVVLSFTCEVLGERHE
jgi:hypothetical protein